MEVALKQALGSVTLTPTGRGGGGCINQGEAYLVDSGTIFAKFNSKKNAKLMFDGELEGLMAITATKTLQVPQPIIALDNPEGGAVLVMEYLDMKSLRSFSKQLGEDLAKLHLHNIQRCKSAADKAGHITSAASEQGIQKFGFHVPTCCGYIPMDNTWRDDWVTFYARNRLEPQIKLVEKDYGDREALELWSQLKLKLPSLFSDIEVFPSLLHGDLWGGNVAETGDRPVAFDPAASYGHHEFDLAIAAMFGGFNKAFYSEYHKHIPQQPGASTRLELYKLFHYLNHWNHFGTGYRDSSLKIMRALVK